MSNISQFFFNKTKIPARIGYFKSVIIFGNTAWFDVFLTLVDSHVEFGTYKSMRSVEAAYKGHRILLYSFGYGLLDLNRVVTEAAVLGATNVVFLNFSLPLRPGGEVRDKDVCIIHASCRNEIATFMEIDHSYPAAAHPLVVRALRQASESMGRSLRPLKSIVVDGFYEKKVKRPSLLQEVLQTDVELMDWDSSAMLVFSSLRDLKSAIVTCVGLKPNLTTIDGILTDFSQYRDEMTHMAKVSLEACLLLEAK